MKSLMLALVLGVTLAAALRADDRDNVRAVQTKLRDGGYYFGEIDGAYSSELAAALSRYQIRNGLAITGQLDTETARALGAKAAVTATPATAPGGAVTGSAQSSETWRKLRRSDEHFLAKMNSQSSGEQQAANSEATPASSASPAGSPAEAIAAVSPPSEGPGSANEQNATGASRPNEPNMDRLRDYVGAFVLAGLDPQVGAETEFFADRVRYFNEGVKDRETIRRDLRRYDEHWPERKFWLAGDIKVDPASGAGDELRVTFPLRFELRNGAKHSAGKVEKTIVLKPVDGDYQIVAVDERR